MEKKYVDFIDTRIIYTLYIVLLFYLIDYTVYPV